MRTLALSQLFAVPIQSAVRAQGMAAQEALTFLEGFGLEDGKSRIFRMTTERVIEKRMLDPESGEHTSEFVTQPFEVSIPLLALVTPPSAQLQDMTVDFGVDLVEPRAEAITAILVPREANAVSLAQSQARFTSLDDSSGTMKVTMKIAQTVPEGTARLGDVLADLLSGRGAEEARRPPPVEELPGIGAERGALLRRRGITNVAEFVRATETSESIRELATAIGVSPKRVQVWREESKLLLSP